MTAITYVAKRNISSGHSASTSYDLEPSTTEISPGIAPDVSQSFTLDGTGETVFNHIAESWRVRTTMIDDADFDIWREFFSSVAGGETFAFDAYGSIASPDNAQTVIMIGSPSYARAEVVESGSSVYKWNMSLSMRVQ